MLGHRGRARGLDARLKRSPDPRHALGHRVLPARDLRRRQHHPLGIGIGSCIVNGNPVDSRNFRRLRRSEVGREAAYSLAV